MIDERAAVNRNAFKHDFDAALSVMWAFNDVVAKGLPARRESALPFSRGRIKNALVYLFAAVRHPETRAAIADLYTGEPSALYLSDEFRSGMRKHLRSLTEFWPDKAAAIREYVFAFDEQVTDQAERSQDIRTNNTLARALEIFAEVASKAQAEYDQYIKEAEAIDLF